MKQLAIFLLICSFAIGKESTEITFDYVENAEQRLANDLNNILMITIGCSDTSMRGKTFKLITYEYKDGLLINTDDYGLTCEDKRDEFEMNGKNYVYIYNACDKVKYLETEDEFKIRIALKQKVDSSSMIIKYKGLVIHPTYESKPNFDLRIALGKTDDKYYVPVGEKTPILTFNPPYDIEGGEMSWYCILDTENPGSWYEKYNINHYYIISLLIE